jgi:serine/threonine protein phosphatase PrpC
LVQEPTSPTLHNRDQAAIKTFEVHAFGFTHVGKVRSSNEDSFRMGDLMVSRQSQARHGQSFKLGTAPQILAVADGVGGRPAGGVASKLVLENLCFSGALDSQSISDGVNTVNAALYARMAEQPDWRGMGSTLAGVAVTEMGVFAFGVGDSFVGRFTGLRFLPLLECQTLGSAPGGALAQVIGCEKKCTKLAPTVLSSPLEPLWLLVATDGVMRYVSEVHLADWAPECPWPEDFATMLEEKILQTPAADNLTAIAVQIAPIKDNQAVSKGQIARAEVFAPVAPQLLSRD